MVASWDRSTLTTLKKAREKQVIARLIDIRKAQLEYRNLHAGAYTASI